MSILLNALEKYSTFVFLDSSLNDKENRQSFLFVKPRKLICCYKASDLRTCINNMQKEREKGNYLAGFLSYEAGYALCRKLRSNKRYAFPLLWMGVFKEAFIYDHQTGRLINTPITPAPEAKIKSSASSKVSNLKLQITKKEYIKNIHKIKDFIAAGDTYQVNYTTKIKFDLKGTDIALYKKLRENQRVGYGAFIKSRQFSILSYSPELFFRQTQNNIYARPMKGTMPRGVDAKHDIKLQKFLRDDPKNRAENIMIVDLLRNDLGKISSTSSVKTTRLFDIEIYKTLLQMTSTIESRLKKDLTLYDLFASLHPSGSVTGAPKIRTMEIIKQLEPQERKIYTGSIGYIAGQETSVFNVAIRTILLKGSKGEMGIGGGITYSSDPESEWEECKLKAKFLTQRPFQLIETMRASKKEGIFLFDLHLKRLRESAMFFDFAFDAEKIKSLLKQKMLTLFEKKIYKLRLLLKASGAISLKAAIIDSPPRTGKTLKICVSPHKLDPGNIYLYHKTTRRPLYNRELKRCKNQGFYDIVFLNKNDELCEGAISNIFIRKNGIYYTPPVSCGLLRGVFREYFINKNREKVREKIIKTQDLLKADSIYCVNSVRGMVKVELVQDPEDRKPKDERREMTGEGRRLAHGL